MAGHPFEQVLEALGRLGFRPGAPVPAEDFADPAARDRWADEKGMTVFSRPGEP